MFEFLGSNTFVLWLAVMLVAVVVEAWSVQLITIWFAIGAFAALISELFSASIQIQFVVFLIVSLGLLIFTRPILKKVMKNVPSGLADNSIVGNTAKVVQEIDLEKATGRVLVGDVNWNAAPTDGISKFPIDANVTIDKVDGTTLHVSAINKESETTDKSEEPQNAVTAQ